MFEIGAQELMIEGGNSPGKHPAALNPPPCSEAYFYSLSPGIPRSCIMPIAGNSFWSSKDTTTRQGLSGGLGRLVMGNILAAAPNALAVNGRVVGV